MPEPVSTDAQVTPAAGQPATSTPQPSVQPTAQPTPEVIVTPTKVETPVSPVPTGATPEPKTQVATDNERTREQFEKLLESNKRLFEANELLRTELQGRQTAVQQFAPIQQPPVVPQAQQETVNPEDFVETDPYTGEKTLNTVKFQAKVKEINERASRAEEAIQKYIKTSEQREVERQNKETFSVYPELDPSNPSFDVTFHNQTRAMIYDSLINPQDYGGRPLEFKDAAGLVKKQMGSPSIQTSGTPTSQAPTATTETQTVPAPTEAEIKAAQDLKEQASAGAIGEQPTTRPEPASSEELDRLRIETRKGGIEALARRLANTPHTGTPTGGSEKAS